MRTPRSSFRLSAICWLLLGPASGCHCARAPVATNDAAPVEEDAASPQSDAAAQMDAGGSKDCAADTAPARCSSMSAYEFLAPREATLSTVPRHLVSGRLAPGDRPGLLVGSEPLVWARLESEGWLSSRLVDTAVPGGDRLLLADLNADD